VAGSPSVGAGAIAGKSRFQLCLDLYNCIATTHCFASPQLNIGGCLCSSPKQTDCQANGGNGPCYAQELAALEVGPGTPAEQFQQVTHLATNNIPLQGHAGAGVNVLFQNLLTNCQQFCPIVETAGDAGMDARAD
jgi:hypothetical protein